MRELTGIHHASSGDYGLPHDFRIEGNVQAKSETKTEVYEREGYHIACLLWDSLPGATVEEIARVLHNRLVNSDFEESVFYGREII